MGLLDWDERPTRRAFRISVKKIEWMRASGRDPFGKFVRTSKCRACKRPLKWGSRTYDFDHRDNNPANNSQKNCYIVCKICHGKATVIKKIKSGGLLGGHKTIKKKVSYKKQKKKKRKRIAVRDSLTGEILHYRKLPTKKKKAKKKKTKKSRRKSSIWDF